MSKPIRIPPDWRYVALRTSPQQTGAPYQGTIFAPDIERAFSQVEELSKSKWRHGCYRVFVWNNHRLAEYQSASIANIPPEKFCFVKHPAPMFDPSADP